MQRNQILPVIGLLMAFASLICNHAFGRLEDARSHQLPVNTFPRKIGDWTSGRDQNVDPEVLKQLATAKIVERVYSTPRRPGLDLVLVSADQSGDMHNPKICLPDQGWVVSDESTIQLGDDLANYMLVTHGLEQIEVLYWFTAKAGSPKPTGLRQKLQALRARAAGKEGRFLETALEGDSLMVRLMGPHTEAGHQALLSFSHLIEAPLQPFKDIARREG